MPWSFLFEGEGTTRKPELRHVGAVGRSSLEGREGDQVAVGLAGRAPSRWLLHHRSRVYRNSMEGEQRDGGRAPSQVDLLRESINGQCWKPSIEVLIPAIDGTSHKPAGRRGSIGG